MAADKIRVSGDPRVDFKSATVNGRKYCQYHKASLPSTPCIRPNEGFLSLTQLQPTSSVNLRPANTEALSSW